MSTCHIYVASQRIQNFWEAFIQNYVFSGEQENESIIRVRVG